jgi:succinate dehydrogenase / fumarate reductase membrane anchor subunit
MSGASHQGSPHWWAMRVTSIALIPLGFWLVYSLMGVAGLSHGQVALWLKDPVHAVVLGLFMLFGLHHSAYGLQVVIEDYLHAPWKKQGALIAVTLFHLGAAGFGLFAIIACALRT